MIRKAGNMNVGLRSIGFHRIGMKVLYRVGIYNVAFAY